MGAGQLGKDKKTDLIILRKMQENKVMMRWGKLSVTRMLA